ncbi:hypothetical protein CHS0354_035708, partial [Potamilus streckersoni]
MPLYGKKKPKKKNQKKTLSPCSARVGHKPSLQRNPSRRSNREQEKAAHSRNFCSNKCVKAV